MQLQENRHKIKAKVSKIKNKKMNKKNKVKNDYPAKYKYL